MGQVKFSLDGGKVKRSEQVPPYSLYGDNGGDYAGSTPSIGQHELRAAAGGGKFTLKFEVKP